MSNQLEDKHRRQFLTKVTTIVAAVGAGLAAIPFIGALFPSVDAEAKGGPIRVKLKGMKPGAQLTVMWRGKPIWIVRRTPEELASLKGHDANLRDPASTVAQQPPYAKNNHRSINPEFLVLVGVCTHLGCVPTYRPEPRSIDIDWPGGFFCTCHGSKFDLAGRVFKGVPAPINLEVPPYRFVNNDEIIIGQDANVAVTA